MSTPSPKETPPMRKLGSGEAYRAGTLEDLRGAVLNKLGGSISEVPLSFFLDHVAPMQHNNIDLVKVKEKLKRSNVFTKMGRWKGFSKDPSKMTGDETTVFKPLEKAIQNVISACLSLSDSSKISFAYVNNPNLAPYSERSRNSGRPDGYFIRPKASPNQRDGSPRDRWDDIFGPTEYKKGSSKEDVIDNARKIIWSLQHIMSSDPRRRFAFGFTIEKANTRVWVCSRTEIFVTESFNFITACEHLIDLIARMVFADEAGLGWDPTIIHGFNDSGKPYYGITVHDKTSGEKIYQTSKVHIRTVYKEVAAPVYTVKGLADSFQVLQDATIGLKLLHTYEIIHRDVSIGNVLEFNDGGKLADLEYAKKMDDKNSHEIRVGTLDFMPIEVGSQAYQFQPRPSIGPDFTIQEAPSPPFQQNYLHDLESVWWIAAFILFCNRDKSEEEESLEQGAHQAFAQLQVVYRMFPRALNSVRRRDIFTRTSVFTDLIKQLPSAFLPVASKLDGARAVLLERYRIAEAGPVIDREAFIGIGQQIIDVLGLARTLSGQTQLFSLSEMLKRKRGFI